MPPSPTESKQMIIAQHGTIEEHRSTQAGIIRGDFPEEVMAELRQEMGREGRGGVSQQVVEGQIKGNVVSWAR